MLAHTDAGGQGRPSDAIKGDEVGGRGQGVMPQECDAGVGAVMEPAGVAEGTSKGAALEATGPLAGAGLGAVRGQDGLSDLFSMDKMWKVGKSGLKWPKNGDDNAVRSFGREEGAHGSHIPCVSPYSQWVPMGTTSISPACPMSPHIPMSPMRGTLGRLGPAGRHREHW